MFLEGKGGRARLKNVWNHLTLRELPPTLISRLFGQVGAREKRAILKVAGDLLPEKFLWEVGTEDTSYTVRVLALEELYYRRWLRIKEELEE